MPILALDTALDACSVAVYPHDGEAGGSAFHCEVIGRGHAERLMAMIETVMAEAGVGFADLDRIGVTIGPGSFTGIRVGLATARGLALATGLPLVGISTLDALDAAARVRSRTMSMDAPVLVVLDARRGEVYAGLYRPDGTAAGTPALLSLTAAAELAQATGAVLFGSGAPLVAAHMPTPSPILGLDAFPDIAHVAALAATATPSAMPPRPLYLRAPDAKPQTRGRAERVGDEGRAP